MENYIGEIKLFAGPFAPRGWALCNGSKLKISENAALFALLGTLYGGDGIIDFALPDLTERACIGVGKINIASGTNYLLAQKGGEKVVSLIPANIPVHSHVVIVSTQNATLSDPTQAYLAASNGSDGYSDVEAYAPSDAVTSKSLMDDNAISASIGSSYPHENMMPFIALNYIIAIEGLFPIP